MIRREKVDVSIERRVLSNLIMSTPLLARCRMAGEPRLFESTMSRAVASWVWEYYDRMGEAPGKAISDIYRQRQGELQPADAELVAEYLSAASDEWMPSNQAYAQDMALNYFQGRALADLEEKLHRANATNDATQGLRLVAEFTRPNVQVSRSISMFKDVGAVAAAFNTEEEEVFHMPAELGALTGPFIREDFVAYLAPAKRGKTWWLISNAVTAALQGRSVLFLSLEMSESQMIRRFWQYLSATSRYGEEAPWPEFVEQGDKWAVQDQVARTPRVNTDPEAIAAAMRNINRMSRGGRLVLRNYPTGTLSVSGLKAELKNLEVYENFVPEVIVLDYADIMDHGRGDSERDKLNNTWKGLRGLASERKAVVITASQTGRQTFKGSKDAGVEDVAEDIRKIAHVTKAITINQSREEQARGIYRLECNTQRDGAVVHDQVVCTSCLAIGRPFLDMKFLSRVDMGGDEYHPDEEQEQPRRSRRR